MGTVTTSVAPKVAVVADEAWVPLAQGIALFLADQGLDARVGATDADDGAITDDGPDLAGYDRFITGDGGKEENE